jgi:hypothetical protein
MTAIAIATIALTGGASEEMITKGAVVTPTYYCGFSRFLRNFMRDSVIN